jgi:RNA polymerase sigma factor (sigma-70 family)
VLSAAFIADQPNKRPSAKQRDRNAQLLSELLQRKEHLLRRQATRHVDGPDDVDDALQSAYALFLERFRGDCEPLAWLYTTVKREVWALRRRGSRQREASANVPFNGGELDLCDATPSDAPGPAAQMERNDQLAERMKALTSLKDDERRALWLIGLGLSYVEICEATGWTHTKVNRCASEGRAALRRFGQLKP